MTHVQVVISGERVQKITMKTPRRNRKRQNVYKATNKRKKEKKRPFWTLGRQTTSITTVAWDIFQDFVGGWTRKATNVRLKTAEEQKQTLHERDRGYKTSVEQDNFDISAVIKIFNSMG